MLAALAASAAPLVDADGFALEGTTTMLAAGRPGSVWMLRTVPLFDDMCVSTDGHGAFGGIADRTYMPSSKRGAVRCWIASDAHPLIGQCKSICSSAVKPKTTINPLDATFDEAKAECRNIYFTPLVHSLYALHLRRWLQTFPRDSLLLLRFDDIVLRPIDVLQRVAGFLALPPFPPKFKVEYGRENYTTIARLLKSGAVTPQNLKALEDFFRPHDATLREMFGGEAFW